MQRGQLEQTYLDNFLRYVRIPTASNSSNASQVPSTKEQFDLARVLVAELRELGMEDVELTDNCFVYAYMNRKNTQRRVVLVAHLDVSEDAPSVGVKPRVVTYEGGPIILENGVRIPPEQLSSVRRGSKVVTSDGTTLLGSDDKSGVAIIMTYLKHVQRSPSLPSVCVCFTPDEEIGGGIQHIDINKLTDGISGAYAITVDGGRHAEIVFETFTGHSFTIDLEGYNIHPGYAYGKMVNSISYACKLAGLMRERFRQPEDSKEKESYVLINEIKGEVGQSQLSGIIRGFDGNEAEQLAQNVRAVVQEFQAQEKDVKVSVKTRLCYKNMIEYIPRELIDKMMRAGNEFGAKITSIRGGTDGCRLSEMGLPTPDIWNGTENCHSVSEFNVVDDAVTAILYLDKLLCDQDK